jgi:hypothetical protein
VDRSIPHIRVRATLAYSDRNLLAACLGNPFGVNHNGSNNPSSSQNLALDPAQIKSRTFRPGRLKFTNLNLVDGGMKLRPRFTLKVLMLFVAAAGIFCAYHVNWIRQRHQYWEQHSSFVVLDLIEEDYQTFVGAKQAMGFSKSYTVFKRAKRSFNFLWLFGEQRHDSLVLIFQISEERSSDDIHHAQDLFPEADIYSVYCKLDTDN